MNKIKKLSLIAFLLSTASTVHPSSSPTEHKMSLPGEFFGLFFDTDYRFRKKCWIRHLKECTENAAKHHFYVRELIDPTATNFTPACIAPCLFTEDEKKAMAARPKIFKNFLEELRKNVAENIKKLHSAAKEFASFIAYYEIYPENYDLCGMRTSAPSDFGWPGIYESQCPIYNATFKKEYAAAKQRFKQEKESGRGSEGTAFTLYPDTGAHYHELRKEEEKKNQAKYNTETKK